MKKTAAFLFSVLLLSACAGQPQGSKYTAGTYQGTGTGKNGDIVVEVTVSDSEIVSVKVVSDNETPAYADPVREEITDAIVKAQSSKIDLVTAASYTQKGIVEAAEDALKKAAK